MDKDRVKAFADKVFADMAGAMSTGLGYVGVKIGLFRALAGKGPVTLEEVVAMTKLQPQLKELQKKHKGDRQKMNEELMKLYKEHNVNPFGGCWPMLLPIPILFALFFVFQNTIELRGVPFLWMPDLSTKDPLYILPMLLAASMWLMMRQSMRSVEVTNPQTQLQQKMMMWILPPFMLLIFLNLASGLNLYYVVSNIATIPQQMWITKERKKMRAKAPAQVKTEAVKPAVKPVVKPKSKG